MSTRSGDISCYSSLQIQAIAGCAFLDQGLRLAEKLIGLGRDTSLGIRLRDPFFIGGTRRAVGESAVTNLNYERSTSTSGHAEGSLPSDIGWET
jgi:hypothetical protein